MEGRQEWPRGIKTNKGKNKDKLKGKKARGRKEE